MTTLTEFLLARIAERESEILNGWDSDGRARIATMWTGGEPGYTTVASDHGDDAWIADGREVEDARHVRVLFDPARDLARCAADRRIVDNADVLTGGEKTYTERMEHTEVEDARYVTARHILLALASVYADHPDYDEAWRP